MNGRGKRKRNRDGKLLPSHKNPLKYIEPVAVPRVATTTTDVAANAAVELT